MIEIESRPQTTIRVTISANNLKDLDVFTKSDPICVVYEKVGVAKGNEMEKTWKDKNWLERGRTEMIKNTLNPSFLQTIKLAYYFEENQLFRFELFDVDSEKFSQNFDAQDFLGRYECLLSEIVSYSHVKAHLGKENEPGRRWRDGDKPSKNGSITLRAEEDEKLETITFIVRGIHLDKKDTFGKSDPYLNFKRKFDDGNWRVVHRTEVVKRSLNPEWLPIQINLKSLCGGDLNKLVTVECYDRDKWKKDDLIGTCQFTINQILVDSHEISLINDRKKARKLDRYTNSGLLKFIEPEIIAEPSFYDYMAGGVELEFAVAIDFTMSNGQITSPTSLHYLSPDKPNQYELAIRSCLSICQHYNSRKTFEGYGFGAKISPIPSVQNVFTLVLGGGKNELHGVEGVVAAYRDTLQKVQLFGPTNMAPIIERLTVKGIELSEAGSKKYQILLIITDGIINDMQNTKRAIVNASCLPMSIIIIGVGNEDFGQMRELDSDDRLLQWDSMIARRDIVQFVTLRQFLNNGMGQYLSPEIVEKNLAREVLHEIPDQLVTYMKLRGIYPQNSKTPWPREEVGNLPDIGFIVDG